MFELLVIAWLGVLTWWLGWLTFSTKASRLQPKAEAMYELELQERKLLSPEERASREEGMNVVEIQE